MISEVLTVVTPVFLIAGLGFLWMKRKQPFDTETIGSLVMYLGSPCLIYSSLTTNAPDLQVLGQMALAEAGGEQCERLQLHPVSAG